MGAVISFSVGRDHMLKARALAKMAASATDPRVRHFLREQATGHLQAAQGAGRGAA